MNYLIRFLIRITDFLIANNKGYYTGKYYSGGKTFISTNTHFFEITNKRHVYIPDGFECFPDRWVKYNEPWIFEDTLKKLEDRIEEMKRI